MNSKPSKREMEVIAAMTKYPFAMTASVLARVMSFDGPCPWCPVLPPKEGEQCAVVPRTSADRCRLLHSLLERGKIKDLNCHRYPQYVRSELI